MCLCVCEGAARGEQRGYHHSGRNGGLHGCFLVLILSLGGAGTDSKHFPEDRKSPTKASTPACLCFRQFIALILIDAKRERDL